MYFKKNKYRNSKVKLEDGTVFDSRKEFNRYLELVQMQQDGLITDLRCQHVINLIPKQKLDKPRISKGGRKVLHEQAVDYIADFTYKDVTGNLVVEDTKGFKTKDYILKRKLLKYIHGIEISEI